MTETGPDPERWHDRAEQARIRHERLPVLLRTAARSPFYRARLGDRPLRTAEDFDALPLTTKQDLRDAYPYGLLAVGRERLATYHESSGTAGTPTASYYTAGDWEDLAERFARKHVPITPDDTFLVRTPYALMITGHLAHAAARLRGATVVPGDSRSAATPPARVVRILHDLEVSLTWSNPTETLLWAAAARAAGWQPDKDFPALRALYVGGEPLSAARRHRIEEIWNVPVVEEYGSTETGSLAGQCTAGRLHLWADRVLFEVLDRDTGTLAREGRGQLVVTPLHREAMPLLRYNLEDEVEVRYEECPCASGFPTVRVFGRSAFGYRVGGRTVTQHALEEAVFGLPVDHAVTFWRARASADLLEVEIEAAAHHGEAAAAELTRVVRHSLGVAVTVTALEPGSLVPTAVLTAQRDVLKPRGLFGPGEDWDNAVLYY